MSRTHFVTIEQRHTDGGPLTGYQAVCSTCAWAGEVFHVRADAEEQASNHRRTGPIADAGETTDMRTTERLLEVIQERQDSIRKAIAPDGGTVADARVHSDALDIKEAVTELCRRGDTLVHASDLELIVQAVNREQVLLGEDEAQALARLDGALGGG